jgi:ubiquinone biosynthesis protein COQ9
MKNKTILKRAVRNGRELTDKEYKIYLEGMAEGVWRTSAELTDEDYYSKRYDPLYINSPGDVASYVFDFHDGGRGHSFKNLKEIYDGLLEEINKSKKYLQQFLEENK